MKNILVVGAGKGIGLKTAELLSKNHKVYTVSRSSTPELEQLDTQFRALDVLNDDLSPLDGLPEALHGLVYCPGTINLKPFHQLTQQDFIDDYTQNVLGAVSVIQKVLPNLKKAEGAGVVLFSTVAAKLGMPYHSSVAAAKSAVEGLAKSLAAEYALAGIRVNVVAPSLTDTSLAATLLNTDEKREAAKKRHPLQRIGTPEEMSHLVAFLLSDASAFITGQVIGADGGMGSLRT